MAALLLVLLAVALVALFFVPYLKSRSYYVGVDDSGNIALYRGLPWKPLGIGMSEVFRSSLAPAENLPEEKRDKLLHPRVMDLEGAEREFLSLTREAESGVRVPDFRGMTWEEAEALALRKELIIKAGEGSPSPGSVVISQSPQPGELAYRLDVVQVEVGEPPYPPEQSSQPDPAEAKDVN